MANIPSVFLSSTFNDLEKEREKVSDALLKIGCFPNGMELFTGPHRPVWKTVTNAIDESDYYLLIVGGRYGSLDSDGIGFTEKEFDYAIESKKPVFVFLHKNTKKLAWEKSEQSDEGRNRLEQFRIKIQKNWCYLWKKPSDLINAVTTSLVKEFKIPTVADSIGKELTLKLEQTNDAVSHPNNSDTAPVNGTDGQQKNIPKELNVATHTRSQPFVSRRFENSRIPQYFIDDLKDRADLVRIIEPYAPLKKKGSNWMGCCPFHQEKTPSFSVSPTKGFYKCFGCGKGGNAYTFLMEMEGLNFPEAIQRVAEMSGVPLPEPIDDRQFEKNKKRKEEKKELSDHVIELNKLALDFWEVSLQAKDKKAKAARKYLETRGISETVQKQFHVGFSPDSWDSLLNHLRASGADEKLIEQSGLVSVNEEKDRVFDRFRGRIMFPVLDVNGNPIAFGARAMGDDQPKYLNSPETPAYIKGQHLYGLFQSREEIRRKKFVILVEGYLDLIALYQFGITNVAASLGTAFTPEQSKLLSRFAKKVVINYDGDDAGIKAARKAVDSLLADDFDVKVLVLPDGKDPDDFIRQQGVDTYDELRGKAQPFLNFVLDSAIKGRRLNVAKQKADAIEDVLPMLSILRNPIQKRESFDQAMDFFRVENTALRRDLWKTVKQSGSSAPSSIKQQVKRATQIKITVAEQQLLELLINDEELRASIMPQLEETDYEGLATAEVFRALYELDVERLPVNLENIIPFVADDETAADFVPLLLMTEPKREVGEVIDNVMHDAEKCVITLRLMAINNRIAGILHDALAAEQAGQPELHSRLTYEQLELEKIKRGLLNQIRES